MKVKSTRNWTISIHTICRGCKFSYTFEIEDRLDASKARSKARHHVATTGHEVEIFTERFCVYKPITETEMK